MCPLQLMFFALFLSCTLVFSTATGCPSLLVSQENRFLSHLSNHLIETNDFLVLMVGMSENAIAYSSLSPQLQSCNNGRISTSLWSQNDDMWTVTLNAINCGLECCVQIFLDSLVSNCVVMEWVGHFFRVTQAPLLQWLTQLNESHTVTQSTSSVPAHTLFQHIQCSPQVAVVISENELSYTISLFNNATNVSSYSICALAVLSPSVCANLSVMDMTLTHSALLLLTSAGLLVSNTTTAAAGQLDWQEVPFSVQEAVFLEQNALYCKDPILNNEMVRVLSPSTDELLMYSAPPPYTNWSVQSTPCTGVCAQELVAFDHQRNTFTTVAVGNNSLAQTSSGQLLGNVSVSDVFYHPTTSSIYLLGSQVWVSIDGGSTFTSLLELSSSVINYTYNEQALLLLTASGDLYHTRPGALHYSSLSAPSSLTHNTSRVVLTRGNTFRMIDLSSKTSELVQIDVKEMGPCSLSYDLINPRTLYLYDNQSDCAVRDLIGYEANATSLGAGLVVSSIGVGILVALSAPVTVSDSGTVQCLFTQEQCWSRISPGTGFNTTTHELDIWDSVELQVVVSIAEGYKLPRHFLDVVVTMGRPDLFDVMTTSNRTPTTHTLTVTVWQRNTTTYPVYSSIRLSLLHCPAVCEQCGLVSIIHTNCPSDKLLQLVCPASVESCTQRYTLPINYRPPSSLGVAIHTSPHVYNADPATLTHSAFSQVAARLNHCENKSSRLECVCECTEQQSTSSDINYSDCIKSVYRHSYGKVFPLTFELLLGGGQRVNTTSVELVELNNRTDYTLITNNSQVTGIRFKGPGLFHFNALLINITSFCELSTPFILFVEHVPLTKAGELAITSLTTVVFGLVTLTVYLLHYFKHSRKKQ